MFIDIPVIHPSLYKAITFYKTCYIQFRSNYPRYLITNNPFQTKYHLTILQISPSNINKHIDRTIPFLILILILSHSWCPTTGQKVLTCFFRLIPESPSWLLVKGRTDQAMSKLQDVAKCNGKELLDEDVKKELLKENEAEGGNESKASLIQMFRTPNLRVNALLVNVICFMGFMCYYGHVQNTSNLGEGNVYKSYFLGAIVEIPCWSIPFIIAKFGRRWPLLVLFSISGMCGLVYGLVPVDYQMTSLTIGLIGRMTVNGAYFVCLQYGSEIFPTVIRGQGVALCEIVGGIAIFLSPTVVYLTKVSPILPLLILGLCSFLGALATFFLPETAGKALPQTLEDGRLFGLDQSKLDCICIKRKTRASQESLNAVAEKEKLYVKINAEEEILKTLINNESYNNILVLSSEEDCHSENTLSFISEDITIECA